MAVAAAVRQPVMHCDLAACLMLEHIELIETDDAGCAAMLPLRTERRIRYCVCRWQQDDP
jgi:hypothetical protein